MQLPTKELSELDFGANLDHSQRHACKNRKQDLPIHFRVQMESVAMVSHVQLKEDISTTLKDKHCLCCFGCI